MMPKIVHVRKAIVHDVSPVKDLQKHTALHHGGMRLMALRTL